MVRLLAVVLCPVTGQLLVIVTEPSNTTQKRSCAAKQEWDREAVKVAKQPPREWQCMACGRKFNSCKTASKHKCPKSKVERMGREAASGQASRATPAAKLDKPPATITPHTPTVLRTGDLLLSWTDILVVDTLEISQRTTDLFLCSARLVDSAHDSLLTALFLF
jgi:predicted RNA-binding Zn-ribbon protein involved in translation (DUF1610 family)